jgi:hypothetical protein
MIGSEAYGNTINTDISDDGGGVEQNSHRIIGS